jgi:ABC-type transport system substrate-binding protein
VGSNRSFYSNATVDTLLDEARVETDPVARKAIYARAQQVLWNDAAWLYLYYEGQLNAQRAVAKGLIHHTREVILAHQAWLDR